MHNLHFELFLGILIEFESVQSHSDCICDNCQHYYVIKSCTGDKSKQNSSYSCDMAVDSLVPNIPVYFLVVQSGNQFTLSFLNEVLEDVILLITSLENLNSRKESHNTGLPFLFLSKNKILSLHK